MKQALRFSLLAVTVASLASCGSVVGNLIPAQTVEMNSLSGKSLAADAPFTTVQRVGTSISYSTPTGAAFDDFAFPSLPLNVKPTGIELKATFASASLPGCVTAPNTITLKLDSFAVSVQNEGDAASRVEISEGVDASMTLTRVGSSSEYAISGGDVSVSSDSAAKTLAAIGVLTKNGGANTPNVASARAVVSSGENGLFGCSVVFTLGKVEAVLSDFR
ncbi:hypothetical protein [Deinococcus pimensis]|uniref:hypothetical protein n=1 Tax=Deinococcus pimensis TaxID=309888 RepID=UPI0004873023|nr:hypothetical protein [Deinococcus pimensis]